MKTYNELKDDYKNKVDALINNHKGFFAFNNEQLNEGMKKHGINSRDELTSLSMGMLIPKTEAVAFMKNMEKATKDFNKSVKEADSEKENAILYELKNHECFYTGEIEEVVSLFDGTFSHEDIRKVYLKHIEYQD